MNYGYHLSLGNTSLSFELVVLLNLLIFYYTFLLLDKKKTDFSSFLQEVTCCHLLLSIHQSPKFIAGLTVYQQLELILIETIYFD